VSTLAVPRQWRVSGITVLGELLSPGRLVAYAFRLAVQIFLVVVLWRALYSKTDSSAGLTRSQAVTYAVLAVLVLRMRYLDRWIARDMMIQHVEFGTIVYWFLRPLSPWRYYFWRAVGDQMYGLAWAVAGYAVCLPAGVVSPPASAGAAAAFAVTFVLGQAVQYYLGLLTDQLCFWAIRNDSAVLFLRLAQNLLSGAYAAMWYFPGWFQAVSSVLPFQSTLSVPLSFYVGRLSIEELPAQLAVQVGWVAALALLTRLVWRRAAEQVVSQGG
jgi:viologen exporter family transport system permease protein